VQRSSGVTAVAVAALIAGVLGCLFAVFMLFSAVLAEQGLVKAAQPNLPVSPVFILVGYAALLLAVGGWSIASAIGLLRLKSWARVSVMILGGLLAVFALFGLIGAGIVSFTPLPIPPGQPAPPQQVKAIIALVLAVFSLAQMAVGIWWIVFLSRRSVGEQFRGAAVLSQHGNLS
jgi:hypothetical protein